MAIVWSSVDPSPLREAMARLSVAEFRRLYACAWPAEDEPVTHYPVDSGTLRGAVASVREEDDRHPPMVPRW